MKTSDVLFIILFVLQLSASSVFGFSTHGTIISRTFDTTHAAVDCPITTTVSFTNAEDYDLQGFYHTEEIPDGLNVNTISVNIDENEVTDYSLEIGCSGDVYPGYVPYRWILETPIAFDENNPVGPDSTVKIVFSVSAVQEGDFDLDEFHWVGYYQEGAVDDKAAFGHSEDADMQTISFRDVDYDDDADIDGNDLASFALLFSGDLLDLAVMANTFGTSSGSQ